MVTGASPQPGGSWLVSALIWLTRIGVYLGLFVGVGGVFFAAWIGQGPSGGDSDPAALRIGLFSAVASLGLQGIDLLNLPLSGLVVAGAMDERAGRPAWAVAPDRDRGDGDRAVRLAQPVG